ncbi:MAG: PorT family protein [Reichenbachiella sp.]
MKTNLIALIFLFISASAYAQSLVQFGIRAGTNYVNNVLVPNDTGEPQANSYRLGYHVGIQTRIKLNDKLFLSPELLFNSKGYKSEDIAGSTPAGEGKINYNYLSVPILLEYRPISRLSLLIGPELNYLLSAKAKYESETIDLLEFWENFVDYNKFDLGLGFGTEYLLTDELTIGVRYFHGLTSIFDANVFLTDEQGNVVSEDKIRNLNRTFQLSISYILW